MLYANTFHQGRRQIEAGPHAEDGLDGVLWFDLVSASDAERSLAEHATGLRVPALADLQEIESSSRLTVEDGTISVSTPMVSRVVDDSFAVSPLGLVLTKDRLLSVRFERSLAFDTFAERFAAMPDSAAHCSVGAFLGILEAMVDRAADVLERVGATPDTVSRDVFQGGEATSDRRLREILRTIGRAGDLGSAIRDGLLGLARIVPFVQEMAKDWTPEALRPRFQTLRQDIASLSDYDSQQSNKVQFLLDATLGFINIEQNNGIKILTVVSVVGVPPTLVASIYGMNFKNIPELQWDYGYPYGLAVIFLSAVLPLLWFWKKGWV